MNFAGKYAIGHYRNARGLGKSMVVFRLKKIFKWKINYILESLPRIEVFGGGKLAKW